MFPGWDEPAFKATFTPPVVLPSGFRAISNMPIAHEEPAGPDRKQVTFGTSPNMSTYLLVLSAGDLERISRTIAGIDVGVNVPSGRTGALCARHRHYAGVAVLRRVFRRTLSARSDSRGPRGQFTAQVGLRRFSLAPGATPGQAAPLHQGCNPCQQKSAQEIVYSQTMRFRRETASGRSLWLGIEGAASAARVGGSPIGPDD